MGRGTKDRWDNELFISFDVGTTACKCQLFSDDGNILEYLSKEYGFIREGGQTYVDIAAINKKFTLSWSGDTLPHFVE